MRFHLLNGYQLANLCGISYTVFAIVGIISLVLFFSCPLTYGYEQCAHTKIIGVIVFFELTINFFFFQLYSKRNDPQRWSTSCLLSDDDQQRRSIGRYCMECDRMAPERSHHCPLCRMCILRKDHHCFMTGGCVGIANQRFFIVFVLWAGIGSALGSYYLLMYLLTFVEPNIYPIGWLKFIAPFAVGRWLASYESFSNMIMCLAFSLSTATSIAAFIFFFSQMFYTLHGYTMYDYHTLCRRYELKGDGASYTERLQLVFGHYWILNFIFPQIWWPNRLTTEIARNIFDTRSKNL
uniref:Palmitoyltransferase n=1 Tax=Parascaris univalens TaxID=6257 RepID=A0A915A9L8_PARUN